MHIKSILTPLLLLSFATGLYNPTEAVITMHIFSNCTNDASTAVKKSVTLVEDLDTSQTATARYEIIETLIKTITKLAAANGYKGAEHCIRFWMKLSKDHINEDYKDNLVYWSKLFNHPDLKEFTTLFIKLNKETEDLIRNNLRSLVASEKDEDGKGVLFFQSDNGPGTRGDKVITKPDFATGTAKKELIDIDKDQIIAPLNQAKEALQDEVAKEAQRRKQQKAKEDSLKPQTEEKDKLKAIERPKAKQPSLQQQGNGLWHSLTQPCNALMGAIRGHRTPVGIMIIIASLVMAAYYNWDALASHRDDRPDWGFQK